MKHVFIIVLIALSLFFWKGFSKSGGEIERLKEQLEEVDNIGDPEDKAEEIEEQISAAEGQRIFMGLLLSMGSAVAVGICVWAYVLPFLAQRATGAIFEGSDVIEQDDPMRDAHAALAQGDYDGAIAAFRKVAESAEGAEDEAPNRLPWVEMAKIYRTHLEDPGGALAVLREALEAHAWEEEDACFLMFRLAEVYREDLEDGNTARAVLQQVIDTFPSSRHSANATHKLHEWTREDEEKALMDQLHGGGSGGNPPA